MGHRAFLGGVSLVGAVVAAASGIAQGRPAMKADDTQPGYEVIITGGGGMVAFSGECLVERRDGGEERVALEGTVPRRLKLEGVGLRCDIVQRSDGGWLRVEVVGVTGGNRSVSRTQGPGSNIRVRMR